MTHIKTVIFIKSNLMSAHHRTQNSTNSSNSSQEEVSKGPTAAQGASLLYVVSFCSDLFGSEAGLSHCRTQMLNKVVLDHIMMF